MGGGGKRHPTKYLSATPQTIKAIKNKGKTKEKLYKIWTLVRNSIVICEE